MYVDVCMHAYTERNKRERYRYTHTHQCHFQNLPQVSNISEQLVVRKTLKTAFHVGSSSTSTGKSFRDALDLPVAVAEYLKLIRNTLLYLIALMAESQSQGVVCFW